MSIILNIESEDSFCELNVSKVKSTVGRSRKADTTIVDERISGIHCSFQLDNDDKIIVKDLSSTNGTTLGSLQIEESFLMIGDQVRIGNTTISIMETRLTQKEKKALTRYTDAAQVRYVDLKDADDAKSHAIKIRKDAVIHNNIANLKQDKLPLNNTANSDHPEACTAQQKLKEKIIQKANQMKKRNTIELNYDNENILALAPETGTTSLIKIDKVIKGSKVKSTKSRKTNTPEIAEKKNLFQVIKSVFNKKNEED